MYRKKNNIQQKLYGSIFIILIILSLIFVFALVNKRKQSEIFKETSKVQLNRSINLYINVKESVLKNTLLDYSYWDEMLEFVKNPNDDWSKINLSPTLYSFKFHALWVFDTVQNEIYSIHDPQYPNLRKFLFSKPIFKQLYKERYIHSYFYCDTILVEFLGSTIHPSDDIEKRTIPGGYLFYARIWNNSFLKEFSDVTASNIKLSNEYPKHHRLASDDIQILKPLESFENRPVAYLSVNKKFDGYTLLNRFSILFIIILLISIILIISILIYTLNKFVNKPLLVVEESLRDNNIDTVGDLNKYTREFSKIGNLISNFIKQKRELEIAKEKAEESDRLKSAFLANMSHEIRSPLNGIIGFSELLAELKTDDKINRYAYYISNRSKDLLRIINDILDFSHIEANQLEVINQKFPLNTLLDELEEIYRIINEKPDSPVKVIFIKGSESEIDADIFRLKQVFINLIDNAIKFTEKGTVEIGYRITCPFIEFYVKDTGIGIPQDKTEIIFERFRQINETPSSNQGGNGLGLAICKGLIELMKGKIWVTSEESKGSIFYFTIPLQY